MLSIIKNLVINITFLGSLLTIAVLFLISVLKDQHVNDNKHIEKNVLDKLQLYSIFSVVLVCLMYFIYYFIQKESHLFKLISFAISIATLVISCLGIDQALNMHEDNTKTYSKTYTDTQIAALVSFLSVLVFSLIILVNGLLEAERILLKILGKSRR